MYIYILLHIYTLLYIVLYYIKINNKRYKVDPIYIYIYMNQPSPFVASRSHAALRAGACEISVSDSVNLTARRLSNARRSPCINATIRPGAENRIHPSTVTVPSKYCDSTFPPKKRRARAPISVVSRRNILGGEFGLTVRQDSP